MRFNGYEWINKRLTFEPKLLFEDNSEELPLEGSVLLLWTLGGDRGGGNLPCLLLMGEDEGEDGKEARNFPSFASFGGVDNIENGGGKLVYLLSSGEGENEYSNLPGIFAFDGDKAGRGKISPHLLFSDGAA